MYCFTRPPAIPDTGFHGAADVTIRGRTSLGTTEELRQAGGAGFDIFAGGSSGVAAFIEKLRDTYSRGPTSSQECRVANASTSSGEVNIACSVTTR